MRQFIEITEDVTGNRMMLGMAHILSIQQVTSGCLFWLTDGDPNPVLARESYARIAAILGGMPSGIVDMMEEDDRRRQGK